MKTSSRFQVHKIFRQMFLKIGGYFHFLPVKNCSSNFDQSPVNLQEMEWHVTDPATGRSVCLASDRELENWLINR